MKRTLALIATAAALLIAGCGGEEAGSSEPPAVTPKLQAIIDAELAKIARVKNCDKLQTGFDRNLDRYEQRDALARQVEGSPGWAEKIYADAYFDRMKELGC